MKKKIQISILFFINKFNNNNNHNNNSDNLNNNSSHDGLLIHKTLETASHRSHQISEQQDQKIQSLVSQLVDSQIKKINLKIDKIRVLEESFHQENENLKIKSQQLISEQLSIQKSSFSKNNEQN